MVCCSKEKQNTEQRIELGRVGEFGSRSVEIDLSQFAQYGNGTFRLLHQRSADFDPYEVTNVLFKGNRLVWNIAAKDTEFEGIGFAEVQLVQGNTLLAKSNPYMTFVASSLEVSDAPYRRGFASDNLGSVVVMSVNQRTTPSLCCCKKGNPEENRVELGHVGEYGARDVKFNLSSFHQFGDGDYALIHKRATDFAPYAVQHYDVVDDELIWHIDGTDTACEGIGYAEIQLVNSGVLLAKSEAFMTFTAPSLGSAELPGSYTQATIDTVAAYAASAKSYMDAAEEAKEEAAFNAGFSTHPPMVSNHNTWMVWDGTQYVDSNLPTKGEDGRNGTNGRDGIDGQDGLSAYDYAVLGGYTRTESNFYNDLGGLSTSVGDAARSAAAAALSEASAADSAEDAEAWAVGTRDGAEVLPGDVVYNNNSKYYSELSYAYAQDAALEASYSNHPPRIGENGNWEIWDGTSYIDSGMPSGGSGSSYAGGVAGDILVKQSSDDYDAAWVAPANTVESDNTLPITSAAVYTTVGNINALLATI